MSKPFIKEYSELNDNPSLISKVSILKVIGKYTMKHHTEGYECAGSCARHTNEKWSVTFIFDNSIHGRSFPDVVQAIDYMSKVTNN